jgi:hypothetical protein
MDVITGIQKQIYFPTQFTMCFDNYDQFIEISDAITRHSYDTFLTSGLDKFLSALADYDEPACLTDNCEEDTLDDSILGLADGIITQFQEGGIISALGYVIDAFGRIIVSTALKYVAITIIGGGVAGVLSMVIGEVVVDAVAIGAGEIVEVIFDAGGDGVISNIIEFVFDAAA